MGNFVNLIFQRGMRQRCVGHPNKEEKLGLATPSVGDTPSTPALLAANGVWDVGIKDYQLHHFDIHADDILQVSHLSHQSHR
ncbi:hypothetical protein N7486_005151 [Penicillium sp. IBT 16267x]|nr:hypothetical protein N7486_005151 [Penicillium sp. IBT 16267x]